MSENSEWVDKESISRLAKRLSYSPETGELTWKPRELANNRIDLAWNSRRAGKRAGGVRGNGYVYVSVEGVSLLCHRVVWALHYGRFPHGQIDHINGDQTDNRIENLREATQTQNNANQAVRSNNTSGHRGVTWNKRKKNWQAQIQVNGLHRVIGHFDHPVLAAEAYRASAVEAFGEFYRVVKP